MSSEEDIPVVTEGHRWSLLRRLGLKRLDLLAMVVLLGVAFGFRFFSPLFPDFFSHPLGAPISNCVRSTPVDARGDLGTLCGLNYPYQRASQLGQPPEGEVFDEIYFGVFAHNDLKGTSYFDPEPPVAKYIIAAGEWGYGEWRKVTQGLSGDPADLGFNTFGWRIMSVIFGSLAVPLMYLLAFKLWPNRWFALAAGTLTAFDGMFFVQSRIGMIDIFPVFFIMLAYTLFLIHLESRSKVDSVITLLLTGAVLGVAISSKWICLAALGSIGFWLVARPLWRGLQLRHGQLSWSPPPGWKLPGTVSPSAYALTLIGALAILPAAIYMASWIPFFYMSGPFHFSSVSDIFNYQAEIYRYHATLTATHPYGSPWYSWPFLKRPVAYYFQGDGLGIDTLSGSGQPLVAGITDLGNPLIWWASIPALISLLYIVVRERSFPAAVILLGFATQYLGFAPVHRVLFLYHMFGGLIFMILALAFVLARLQQALSTVPSEGGQVTGRRVPWLIPSFLVLVIVTFLYFYPMWTGTPIGRDSYLGSFPQGKMWSQSWI
jgi:dolichyl-phosphate-mannose-protein mannosyltransferase